MDRTKQRCGWLFAACAAASVILGAAGSASAQSGTAATPSGFEVQNLHLSTRQTHSHVAFPVADVPQEFNWEAGVFFQFAQNGVQLNVPRRIQNEDGTFTVQEREISIVRSQIMANVWGSVAIASRLELGIELPLYLGQITDEENAFASLPGGDPSSGIGDPRVVAKVLLFDAGLEDQVGFAMSIGGDLFLPLGNEDDFQGEGVRGEVSLLNSLQIPGGYRVTGKVGYYFRPEAKFFGFDVASMVTYGLAFLAPLTDTFELDVDVFGGAVVGLGDDFGPEDAPLEALATGRYLHESGFFLQGSVGTGLVSGFGVPTVRAGIAVGFGSSSIKDADKDGIRDDVDECPNEKEDFDGVLDSDGCPDPDNDNDGIPDVDDQCPNRSGLAADNGCPSEEPDIIDYRPPTQRQRQSRDSDGDGIPDVNDQCPDDPEDVDGYQDSDGCPDDEPTTGGGQNAPNPSDRDGDGLENSLDFCPDEAEDFDGILDDDGCPEDDADYDGLPDEMDACPMLGGEGSADGCPR